MEMKTPNCGFDQSLALFKLTDCIVRSTLDNRTKSAVKMVTVRIIQKYVWRVISNESLVMTKSECWIVENFITHLAILAFIRQVNSSHGTSDFDTSLSIFMLFSIIFRYNRERGITNAALVPTKKQVRY